MVEVPGEPAKTVTLVGPAVNAKSGPELKITNTLRVRLPPVPVTVTLKTPLMVESHARAAVPFIVEVLNVMLFGVRLQVRPVGGEIFVVRLTFPEKPLKPAMVIVDDPLPGLGEIFTAAGLADSVKSLIV